MRTQAAGVLQEGRETTGVSHQQLMRNLITDLTVPCLCFDPIFFQCIQGFISLEGCSRFHSLTWPGATALAAEISRMLPVVLEWGALADA